MKHTTPFCHPCNTVVLSVFAIAGFGPFEPYPKFGLGRALLISADRTSTQDVG